MIQLQRTRVAFRRAIVLIGLLAMACGVAMASTGGLRIKVQDDTGPLPGATVTISNLERKIKTTSQITNKDGEVFLPVLPVGGAYVIEVSFPGFGTQRRDELRVKPGENQNIVIQLAEEYTEKVTVIGERDVVDLEKTETSTKFTDEFISDLPVPGRFYQNVLTLAPGVQDANNDGNVNVHGSRARDFKAMVGGVSNVDPLTGQFATNVNPNSIEEMEVITAGAGPQFGRAQGGFANIIQKQGGNEFEGVFDFIYRSSDFDGDGARSLSARRTPEFDWVQPSIQVSGPIIKDKLWYRLSHEWIDREDPIDTVNSIETVTTDQQINSDQITWQVSDRNKLAFKYDSNPIEITNFGVSSLTPPESAQQRQFTGDTFSVVWDAPYSPQMFVKSVVAWQDLGFEVRPTTTGLGNTCVTGQPFLENARCFDAESGEVSGSFFLDYEDERQRFTVRSDATVYPKNKFLGMNHELQFGLIVENERFVRQLDQRPDITFFKLTPDADTGSSGGQVEVEPIGIVIANFTIPQTALDEASGATWGAYFVDQMKPRQNVTIEFGARVDREIIDSEGYTPFDPLEEFTEYRTRVNELIAQGRTAQSAAAQVRPQVFTTYESVEPFKQQLAGILGVNTSVINFFGPTTSQAAFQQKFRRRQDIHLTNTNLSPFLAVSWDPWSNGRTKFSATAGRYYNNLPLVIPTFELNPIRTSVALTAERRGGDWVVDDITDVRGSVNPAANLNVVDRNLKTPYQDEWTFTFDRELWAETSLSVQYINRRYRDQLQDIDINHQPGDFGTCLDAFNPGDPPIDFSVQDGIIDDCTGEYFLPPGAKPSDDPFNRANRIERPDGFPDLYTLNPFWGPIYKIGNNNEADYDAVVLQLTRRQYRGWEMQGSYTWSEAKGNGEDFSQFLGDDQSNVDDEFGFQSNDQRHVVKWSATTITPWGIRLGGTVTWQSGLPYSLLRSRLSIDNSPPSLANFGSNEPRTRIQYKTGERNDQRNVSFWNFDVKATKEFQVGGRANLQLAAEIFNLLNEGTYTVYNNFSEIGFQINGQNDAFRRFGRRFQLSMKASF